MLITKTTPAGIDIAIQNFQTWLHDRLIIKWGLSGIPGQYKCYGRCYRNQTTNGYVAENYTGSDKYEEVYLDDGLHALSFFGVGNIKHDIMDKADVHLVFFVDIKKLKPSITHRADEEVRKDVIDVAIGSFGGFDYKGMDFSVENVLREYPGSRQSERLKFVDMHPHHCFRLNYQLTYNAKNICLTQSIK